MDQDSKLLTEQYLKNVVKEAKFLYPNKTQQNPGEDYNLTPKLLNHGFIHYVDGGEMLDVGEPLFIKAIGQRAYDRIMNNYDFDLLEKLIDRAGYHLIEINGTAAENGVSWLGKQPKSRKELQAEYLMLTGSSPEVLDDDPDSYPAAD